MYLLDTNACIQILNGTCPALDKRLRQHAPSEVFLCSVVKAELLFGAHHSARVEENLALLERFFAPFVSLPFDDRCAEQYGPIRTFLTRSGRPLGPNDMMIAATGRAHDLIVVTHNTREFSRVPDLQLEDWQTPGD